MELSRMATYQGGTLEWYTQTIWPGSLPFMTGEGVEPYAVRTVRALDAPGALGGLRQAALEGATEPYTVWGPDHWRDA
eukprot:758102-Lingulodinium_polyedra.AAC.1